MVVARRWTVPPKTSTPPLLTLAVWCSAIALNLSGIVSNLKETKDPALKQEKLDFIYSKIRFTLDVDYWAGVSGELKKMSCASEPWMDEEN